jgi:hypothetical protein
VLGSVTGLSQDGEREDFAKLLLQPDPSRWTLPLSSYLSMRQMAVLPRETVTTGKKYCTTKMMVRGMLSTVLSLFT